jgi:hypothetical protein
MLNPVLNKLTDEEIDWILQNSCQLRKAVEERNSPKIEYKEGECFVRHTDKWAEFIKITRVQGSAVWIEGVEIEYSGEIYFRTPTGMSASYLSEYDSFDVTRYERIKSLYDSLNKDIDNLNKKCVLEIRKIWRGVK